MKIAIGMIVRNLMSARPLTDFLDNAEKYGHPIERVIVVYSHEADPEAIRELQRRTKVSLIRLQSYERAHMILKQLGVRFSSIQQLLFCPLRRTNVHQAAQELPLAVRLCRNGDIMIFFFLAQKRPYQKQPPFGLIHPAFSFPALPGVGQALFLPAR